MRRRNLIAFNRLRCHDKFSSLEILGGVHSPPFSGWILEFQSSFVSQIGSVHLWVQGYVWAAMPSASFSSHSHQQEQHRVKDSSCPRASITPSLPHRNTENNRITNSQWLPRLYLKVSDSWADRHERMKQASSSWYLYRLFPVCQITIFVSCWCPINFTDCDDRMRDGNHTVKSWYDNQIILYRQKQYSIVGRYYFISYWKFPTIGYDSSTVYVASMQYNLSNYRSALARTPTNTYDIGPSKQDHTT